MMQDHKKVTGLSGNEIYCLNKLGMRSGQLCVGNSVVSLGVLRGLGAGVSTLGGGEVSEITRLVHDGRMNAFNRMMEEAKHYGGTGLASVAFEVSHHGTNLEFVALGSTIHGKDSNDSFRFSTSGDAQQLFCQMDAGFEPRHFVFGNVAYSIGVGGNILGSIKRLARGEVKEFSDIFDTTRHIALQRIIEDAKQYGANAIVGIQTIISPLMGTQEMMMVGTASRHPALGAYLNQPVTSDMTSEETWNMVNLGYLPLQLVMGVSVYSLGLKSGILSALQSLGGGEVSGLTDILYEAREKALARIEKDAERIGADEVIGVKTRVYDLGNGLVEFMAIGTAVKKFDGITTKSDSLPPQAIIQDRETFLDGSHVTQLHKSKASSATLLQRGPTAILGIFWIALVYFFSLWKR